MEKQIITINGVHIAVIKSGERLITDAQTALDLTATVASCDRCQRMVLNKEAFIEDFFKLSTGLAGDILQKFVNYGMKVAVVGDFTIYSSQPLKDFIYECNRGNQFFFVADEQTAIEKLAAAV